MPKQDKYTNFRKNLADLSKYYAPLNGYLSLLGRDRGYCFGLVHLWGHAILSQEVKRYFIFLYVLTNDYDIRPIVINKQPYTQLSSAIKFLDSQRNYKSCSIHIHGERQYNPQLLEILTLIVDFLEDLLLYHNPSVRLGAYLIPRNKGYSQNSSSSSKHIHSFQIKGGSIASESSLSMVDCFNRPFCHNIEDFSELLTSLFFSISKLETPFFIVISSLDHTIGLSNDGSKLTIYDANIMHEGDYQVSYRCRNFMPEDRIIPNVARKIFTLFDQIESSQIFSYNLSIKVCSNNIGLTLKRMGIEAEIDDVFIELRQELTSYVSYMGLKRVHKHKGRARYVIRMINNIKRVVSIHSRINQLLQYLIEEKQLVNPEIGRMFNAAGGSDGSSAAAGSDDADDADGSSAAAGSKERSYEHFKNGSVSSNKEASLTYVNIINMAIENIQALLLLDANHSYFKTYLPRMLEGIIATKAQFPSIVCRYGHSDVVGILIENKNVMFDPAHFKYFTPMAHACGRGHIEVVEVLMKAKVALYKPLNGNFTLLHMACFGGHIRVVDFLLTKSGIIRSTINEKNTHGDTVLHIATSMGYLEVVTCLLKVSSIDINLLDGEQRSSIEIARCKFKQYKHNDVFLAGQFNGIIEALEGSGKLR